MPALRNAGILPAVFAEYGVPIYPHTIRDRGYLPHWEASGATYAVTFRLADSLPQSVLEAYQSERQCIIETAAQMKRELSRHEQDRLDQLYSERVEEYLDQGAGACHLRNPEIGQMAFDAIRFFHGARYDLAAWCVMPNHVHVLLRPTGPHELDGILHSWKSFTANAVNRILGRRGSFWMPEYYDHLIRDAADFRHHIRHILDNPRRAGLKSWPWVASFLQEPGDGGQDARVT